MRIYKCARIDWVDSNGIGKWHPLTDELNKVCKCVSIGMIIRESKEAITVTVSRDLLTAKVDSSMTIPKCSIKSIIRFST